MNDLLAQCTTLDALWHRFVAEHERVWDTPTYDVYAAHAGWPSDTLRTHWETPDPADVVGSEADIKVAFEDAYEALHARIQQFLSLQFDHLDDRALLREIVRIGERCR